MRNKKNMNRCVAQCSRYEHNAKAKSAHRKKKKKKKKKKILLYYDVCTWALFFIRTYHNVNNKANKRKIRYFHIDSSVYYEFEEVQGKVVYKL